MFPSQFNSLTVSSHIINSKGTVCEFEGINRKTKNFNKFGENIKSKEPNGPIFCDNSHDPKQNCYKKISRL